MSYRYTNTDKWSDAWFSNLKPIEKLLFTYLCDNCDIAGFIEVNIKKWASDIGCEKRVIQGAMKGLSRGLIFSNTMLKEGEPDCIFLRTFLKHQKNLPINETNKAHQGILKRFDLYSYKFDIKDINEFIQGASKGLSSPTGNGNGIGNGIGNDLKEGVFEKNWKSDFEIYLQELRDAYAILMNDKKFIEQQEKFHPNVDIKLSIDKAIINFWATKEGWSNKKGKRIKEINWKSTLTKAIDMNKVYKPKNTNEQESKVYKGNFLGNRSSKVLKLEEIVERK